MPSPSTNRKIDERNLQSTVEPAWAMLIDAHASLENHDAAETAFYMAQDALDDSSAHVLVAMSSSLLSRSLVDRAVWCAREALKLDSNVEGGRLRLASALVSSGKGYQLLWDSFHQSHGLST